MTVDLSSFKTAQDLDDYVTMRVESLLEKSRPKPRYATVVTINTETKTCNVRFLGESDIVGVPYTSIVPNEVGQTVRIEGVPGDRYITGIRGTSEQEAALRAARDDLDSNISATAANQSTAATNFNDIKTSRPLYEGVDPSGEGTFDYQQLQLIPQGATGVGGAGDGAHAHTIPLQVPLIACTNNIGLLGFIRHNLSSIKQNSSFLAYSSGSVTEFYYDIYRLSTTDGSMTKLYGSPNVASSLSGVLSWMRGPVDVANQFTTNPRDVSVVQFSMRGSGQVFMAGITLPAPVPPPGFVPQQVGGIRDTSGTRAPDFISGTVVSSFYSAQTVYCQLGTDISTNMVPRIFYEPFDVTTNFGANYIVRGTSGDYVTVSDGSFVHAGPDGFAIAMRQISMTTDRMFIDATISAFSVNTFVSLHMGNYNASGVYFECRCYKNRVVLGYTPGFGGTFQTISGSGGLPSGEYKLTVRYNPADKSYKAYLNDRGIGEGLEIAGFIDASNLIPREPAYRFVGVGVQQGYFDNAGGIREFTAGDW